MRIPKPWTKKRGKRLLGGALSGVVGESLFFALLFLAGVFGLALMLIQRVAEASSLVKAAIPDAMQGIPQAVAAAGQASSSQLGFWIVSILSLAMIGVGGGGVIYALVAVGASDERRSALAARAGKIGSGVSEGPVAIDPLPVREPSLDAIPGANPRGLSDTWGSANTRSLSETRSGADGRGQATRPSLFGDTELPSVPQGRGITDSPGTRLAYRLASEKTVAGRALATASLALLWNAAWFVLLAVVVSGFLTGNPRWVLSFLLLPFAGIGIWAFRYFMQDLRQAAGVGPTIVEIDDHPLVPGKNYRLFVSQRGRLNLRRLRVELICEEETMFRQGTDVRIDRHVAFTKILSTERDLSIDPHRPWEQELQLDLPFDAMHSFRSANNAVSWRITVSGDSRPWPSFCLNFPVFVHPSVPVATFRSA